MTTTRLLCSKNPLRVLAICSNYKETNIYLPGVDVDKLNLYQFTHNANSSLRMLENPSKEEVRDAIETFQPNIIWMCGHGVLNDAKENVYIIDGSSLPRRVPARIAQLMPRNKLTEPEFTRLVLSNAKKRQTTLYIFDFCHSCTMLDLPYFFENGFFYKKLGGEDADAAKQRYVRFEHLEHLFIVISGCSDFETTEEDVRGGLLTQQLLYLLRREKALSLQLLDTSLTRKARISTSRPVDPQFIFCEI